MSRLSETFRIGALEVAALSDGAPERALGGFFSGIEPAEWTRALGITDPEQQLPFNFGAFLIRGDGHVTLVDTGLGARSKEQGIPGGGELIERLAELDVTPPDVDTIVHTHLHGDHCGWNVNDEAAGAITFPNATIHLHQRELDYWTSNESDDNAQSEYTRTRIVPVQVAGRVRTFDGEHAISDALTMVPTPGHTPGHCSVMLASNGEHLLITGDAAHHPIHFEHHDWLPGVDLDPAESTRSRAKISALAAERGALVTGGHFPIPTFGRVERVETGYRWVPA
ncbi:MAG: MBL fold metallo-hydrolase [Dehalococcoidia bacterium]